jgi:hypothetical protein
LPQTSGEARITGSITRQVSRKNTFSIRPNYQYESEENRDAGGTTLASAATTFKHHEQQVTYTQQTIITPLASMRFQRTITTCQVSGRARMSIAGIASCWLARSPASRSSISAWR